MIKLYICCLVLIIGRVEVGLDIDMKFHQEEMEIVSCDMNARQLIEAFIVLYINMHGDICHASARPPAFQSTAPHFPSSLDGIRNHKAQNGSHSSECSNQTLPSKSDTALFSRGKASANQRLSCH